LPAPDATTSALCFYLVRRGRAQHPARRR